MPDPASIDATLEALARQRFRAGLNLRGRGCLERWHGIAKGRELSEDELEHAVEVICRWNERDLAASGRRAPR